MIFAAATGGAPHAGQVAIVVIARPGLGYSVLGGGRARLRTDAVQMIVFLAVLAVAFGVLVTQVD